MLVWSFMEISRRAFKLQSGHEYMMELTILMFEGLLLQNQSYGSCAMHINVVLYIWVSFHENHNGF